METLTLECSSVTLAASICTAGCRQTMQICWAAGDSHHMLLWVFSLQAEAHRSWACCWQGTCKPATYSDASKQGILLLLALWGLHVEPKVQCLPAWHIFERHLHGSVRVSTDNAESPHTVLSWRLDECCHINGSDVWSISDSQLVEKMNATHSSRLYNRRTSSWTVNFLIVAT